MVLFFRKDIGFGRTAVFLLLSESIIVVKINIVCISTDMITNGRLPIVMTPCGSNLYVKSMLEIS